MMNKSMSYKENNIFRLIQVVFKLKGTQILRQITFTTGRIRWGWTPPQFQNAFFSS